MQGIVRHYNTRAEIDVLVEALEKARKFFA